MSRQLGPILLLTALLVAGCFPPGASTPAASEPTAVPTAVSTAVPTAVAGLPNPAALFCEQQGYSNEIRTAADGSQSGVCRFPDGSECDEWAYYRGECEPGAGMPPVATATPPPAATPPPTPTPLPPPATPAPTLTTGEVVYTSDALGISFRYLPEQNGQAIKVLEQGDKVYIYPAHMEPTAGQWVQSFPKPADESLVDAITRVFMPGHPAEDCLVKPVDHPLGRGDGEPAYEYAGIVVRSEPGESMEDMLPRWRTCPQPYTVVGGVGYFQADPQHPDKFLFFSIGQYGIMAGNGESWQDTVVFE